MAKTAANEIKGTFREIGSAFSEIGSSMGGLGGQIAGSLGSISKVLDPLLGSFKTLSGVGAGLAGSFVIAGAGAIATAIHFSETAAKAEELSHATGLSTESISALGNVAATRGVSMEALAKGLERMSRSALAAAKNPMAATNAYREFGIQIQDVNGKVLGADQILMNTADRFAEFEDGPAKTAAAIKIFGRAGAEMIGLLDLGGEHINKLKKDFDDLGATISTSTGEGSVRLKENMTLMGAAFTGFENELTAALLPALNEVGDEFISSFKDGQGTIKAIADALAFVAKSLIEVGQIFGLVFKILIDGVELIQGGFEALGITIRNVAGAMVNAVRGDWKGAWDNIKTAGEGAFSQIHDSAIRFMKEAATDTSSTLANMYKTMYATAPAPEEKKGKKELPNPMKDEDLSWMERQVDQFNKAAERAEELSGKIGLLGAAEMEYTAHVKAATEIEKLRDEEHAKNEKLGKGATYETEAFKEKLKELIPVLEEASLKEVVFNSALKAGEGLDKLNKELERQAAHFRDDAEAMNPYQKEMAALQEKLVPAKEEIQALTDELGKTKDPATVRVLIERIAALIAMTDKAKVTIADIGSAFQSNAISNVIKETT
ncbi:MAG: phage tail tape measure protein, partial [Candidatus Paceibacteria bacterium]